jgi:hypothetical protein
MSLPSPIVSSYAQGPQGDGEADDGDEHPRSWCRQARRMPSAASLCGLAITSTPPSGLVWLGLPRSVPIRVPRDSADG